MKRVAIIAIFGVMCCLVGTMIGAAEAPSKEEAFVAAEVCKMFKVTSTAKELKSAALKKVTDASIYDVKVRISDPDGSSSGSSLKVIKQNKTIALLERPSTNQPCPWMKTLINKTFKLKTEQDAKTLEAALDELYPISDSFGGRDKKAKAIRRQGRTVTFVRGVFFKKFGGFVFETDENGSIVNVRYSLKIKAKSLPGGRK
jgi:hypothetical protein